MSKGSIWIMWEHEAAHYGNPITTYYVFKLMFHNHNCVSGVSQCKTWSCNETPGAYDKLMHIYGSFVSVVIDRTELRLKANFQQKR